MPDEKNNNPTAANVPVDLDKELADDEAKANEAAQQEAQGEEAPATESAPEGTPQKDKEEEKEEDTEVDLSQLSEKAQKRFRDLSQKAKRAEQVEEENQRLRQLQGSPKLEITPPPSGERSGVTPSKGLPWDTDSEGAEPREITEEEYQQHVTEAARKVVREELGREQAISQFNSDVTAVEDKYPELKPPRDGEENPDFDQDLVNQIGDWYKQLLRTNRNLRLSNFVDRLMDLRSKGAEKGRAEVSATLAKQAAEQATPSTGTPRSEGTNLEGRIKAAQSPEELEELEKLLPHA